MFTRLHYTKGHINNYSVRLHHIPSSPLTWSLLSRCLHFRHLTRCCLLLQRLTWHRHLDRHISKHITTSRDITCLSTALSGALRLACSVFTCAKSNLFRCCCLCHFRCHLFRRHHLRPSPQRLRICRFQLRIDRLWCSLIRILILIWSSVGRCSYHLSLQGTLLLLLLSATLVQAPGVDCTSDSPARHSIYRSSSHKRVFMQALSSQRACSYALAPSITNSKAEELPLYTCATCASWMTLKSSIMSRNA